MKGVLLRADCFDVFPQIETGSIDMELSRPARSAGYAISSQHITPSLATTRTG